MSSSADSEGAERTPAIPVICGPTASGKSDIALWLAARHPVEIISADSRQIYRGFDIGTAKPSASERERVPHHCIDVADPAERYSAAEWAALAQRAIHDVTGRGRIPLVVGGTGFYIGALFKPLWEQPELDAGRRHRLQQFLDGLAPEALRRWCAALDPARAHLGRAQLLRAVEIALLTGWRLSTMHVSRSRASVWMPRPHYLLVDPGTELQARIAARAAAMLEAGWVDEVRDLVRRVPDDAPAWNATGYDRVRRYLRGETEYGRMIEQVVIDTRQYAKRQRTWFRHQLAQENVTRLHAGAPGWQERVEHWISGCRSPSGAPGRA